MLVNKTNSHQRSTTKFSSVIKRSHPDPNQVEAFAVNTFFIGEILLKTDMP